MNSYEASLDEEDADFLEGMSDAFGFVSAFQAEEWEGEIPTTVERACYLWRHHPAGDGEAHSRGAREWLYASGESSSLLLELVYTEGLDINSSYDTGFCLGLVVSGAVEAPWDELDVFLPDVDVGATETSLTYVRSF